MSASSTLFINENEDVPECPFEPFLPDSSDSDNDSEIDDVEKHTGVVEDESDDDTIYCVCRKTARGFMVGCDGQCENWFHGDCVGIEAKQKDMLKQFVCPTCTKDGHGITLWEGTGKEMGGDTTKQDSDVADTKKAEDNISMSRANDLLCLSHNFRKQASQSPQLTTTTHKNYIGRSRLRVNSTFKHQAPPSPAFAAASRVPIAKKLKYSLPTFENRPPVFRAQPKIDRNDSAGDSDSDGEKEGDARGRSRKLNAILSAGSDVHKPATKAQRRSYIEVEEAPTSVDVVVKKCLEKALFGAQDE